MGRDINPKCKQCRRSGEKLFLKGERCQSVKCGVVKRNYAPGFHGPKGRSRATDYGLQLKEKQKAKKQYCLMEGQFKLTFEKSKKQHGNTGENFIKLLETRFDNFIYRVGIASSRPQARQFVNHGLFTINGKKVNIPSYQLKTGDTIKIKSNRINSKVFQDLNERLKKKDIPGWINYDATESCAKVLHMPDVTQMKQNFSIQMIIEYYSR
jgi:small subunit ribosomal protein S4